MSAKTKNYKKNEQGITKGLDIPSACCVLLLSELL